MNPAVPWKSIALALVLACPFLSPRAAEFDCIIEPRQVIEIRSEVEGLIDKVWVERGDMVKAGQVVVTLRSDLDRANVDLVKFRATMEGTLHSGEARLKSASQKLARREQLHNEKFISAQDRDDAAIEKQLAEAELLIARDNRHQSELELRRAGEQLQLRTLRTPVSGVVVDRMVYSGELADNRDLRKPILKIADIGSLHVQVLLPVEAYGLVKPGMMVDVLPELPVGGRYPAKVKVVDRVLDIASATFGVLMELPNPGSRLPAGLKCKADFSTVPRGAATPGRPQGRSRVSGFTPTK